MSSRFLILQRQISLFSGEEFNVDESLGLNGRCDFLISRSPEQLAIEAPTIVIVEAKQADLKTGIGQCVAEMVAAQKFNQEKQQSLPNLYGSITNGLQLIQLLSNHKFLRSPLKSCLLKSHWVFLSDQLLPQTIKLHILCKDPLLKHSNQDWPTVLD